MGTTGGYQMVKLWWGCTLLTAAEGRWSVGVPTCWRFCRWVPPKAYCRIALSSSALIQ
ncbi:hypothetical protein ACFRNT_43315 [Streptomyces sp. NPDC056697]|uniref:hypothetical protein n=1 Tax=Streptomyces sp. NPDC056697 TaxID=3345915 RepID=UPI0036D13D3E